MFHSVTESGIHCSLLKSQERGQFGVKESLLYFGCWQPRKWAGKTPQAALTVILKLIIGGLTSVILIVLNIIFSSRLFFSYFLGASSQNCSSLRRDLRCGHHVANFFHLVGISVSIRQLTGRAQIIYSPCCYCC